VSENGDTHKIWQLLIIYKLQNNPIFGIFGDLSIKNIEPSEFGGNTLLSSGCFLLTLASALIGLNGSRITPFQKKLVVPDY